MLTEIFNVTIFQLVKVTAIMYRSSLRTVSSNPEYPMHYQCKKVKKKISWVSWRQLKIVREMSHIKQLETWHVGPWMHAMNFGMRKHKGSRGPSDHLNLKITVNYSAHTWSACFCSNNQSKSYYYFWRGVGVRRCAHKWRIGFLEGWGVDHTRAQVALTYPSTDCPFWIILHKYYI